jgi:hypothetical protein
MVDDQDETVMSLNRLVQIKEDRKVKMRNDNFKYDFAVVGSETLSPDLVKFCIKSNNVKISLSENPFQTFGKCYNIRVRNSQYLGCFNSVLSQTLLALRIKKNLQAIFFDKFPNLRGATFKSIPAPEPMRPMIDKNSVVPRRKTSLKGVNEGAQNVQPVAPVLTEIQDESLCLVFKPNINAFATRLTHVPVKSEIFDVRGPFGTGLGINRFTYGGIILAGHGSACLSFVDFIDFLARMYMYKYAKIRWGKDGTSKGYSIEDLDPYKDDFEECFTNSFSVSFYLSLTNYKEFEALYAQDLQLISQLETELGLGVFRRAVIRLKNEDATIDQRYPGVVFTKTRIQSKNIPELLTQLDFQQVQKVEKVISAGRKSFCDELRFGLVASGLSEECIKSF